MEGRDKSFQVIPDPPAPFPLGVLLRGHVTCTHSYNLGSLDADVAANQGVDIVARNGRLAREHIARAEVRLPAGWSAASQLPHPHPPQSKHKLRARAGSVVSLKYLPEDESGPPMPVELYLEAGDRPWW